MSEQGVTALMERLETDQGFRERLQAAPTGEAKRQIVRDAGFDVERSDLPALRAKAGLQQELSDEDLQRVAGGQGTVTTVTATVLTSVAAAAAVCA